MIASSKHLLDRVQSPAQIDAFDRDAFHGHVRDELVALPDYPARDDAARDTLLQIDAMIQRAAKIRLEYAFATSNIPPVTRNVFATTILSYAENPELLRRRVHEVAVRGGDADPYGLADRAVEIAAEVIALRNRLYELVFDVVRERATVERPIADATARDRRLEEAPRKRASVLRRELEAIAADPTRIILAPYDKRIAAHPDQLDEPDPADEPSFADMIELD